MARSYKHVRIAGVAGNNRDKMDKRKANRALRHAVMQELHYTLASDKLDNLVVPVVREVSDVWGFNKEGKKYHSDPETSPKLFRK